MEKLVMVLLVEALLVAMVVMGSTSGQHRKERKGREGAEDIRSGLDTCPLGVDIFPCSCTWDEDLWQPDLYCPHIQSLEQLQNIFATAFFPTKRFWRIRVSGAPLGELPEDLFHEVAFDEVHLNTCNITSVHPEAFRASKPHMDTMEMYSNLLTDESFPWSSLQDYPKLWRLQLDDNLFTLLPSLVSDALEDLKLWRNPITSFNRESFEGTPNLRIIDIRPHVTSFPEDTFLALSHLEELRLNNNRLGDLHAGQYTFNSDKFDYLHLSNTSISHIEPDAITGITSTRLILELQDNNLTRLEEAVFRPLMGRMLDGWGGIELEGNPLVCDCDMFWLLSNATLLANVRSGACGGVDLEDVDISSWSC